MVDWRERLAGVDPFDALRGARVPRWVSSSARCRQVVVQLRKRLPIDISPLLGVRPFVMAKSVGAFLAARSRSHDALASRDVSELAELALQTDGFLGEGRWGYEFDVQTRWAFYPSGSPNLIATVFCARGFAEAGVRFGRDDWIEHLHESARWVDQALLSSDGFIRYVPENQTLVHNANLLGSALLATSGRLRDDRTMLAHAISSARVTIEAQRVDGSWAYGEGPGLEWEDSFHTAYILDALLQLWLATGDPSAKKALHRGVAHWVNHYFGTEGEPWFSPRRHYPIDIHSGGTAVDVLSRLASFGFVDRAYPERCASWTEKHLVDQRRNITYARRLLFCTDRRHFVRWGDAHWALGESALQVLQRGDRVALETAVSEAVDLG